MLVLAIGAIGIGILRFRHARTAPYYFMREAARRSGIRWFLLAVVALILGGSTFYIREHLRATIQPPVGVTVTASAMALSPTATVSPSPTATHTPSPSPSPTLPPPTATPSPTPTPFYPMPDTARSPLPGAVPARPEARIVLETFALGEENGRPVRPGDQFAAGDFRVYAFIRYEGMSRGATWTYGWYREGEYLDGNTCLWWTRLPDCPYMVGENGLTFLYYRRPGGYDPGTYEVRIWIEDRFQGAYRFTIVPAR
ncbi:MAG: hypothetical protein ACK4WK_02205 [Anaerolineae bacterium]